MASRVCEVGPVIYHSDFPVTLERSLIVGEIAGIDSDVGIVGIMWRLVVRRERKVKAKASLERALAFAWDTTERFVRPGK